MESFKKFNVIKNDFTLSELIFNEEKNICKSRIEIIKAKLTFNSIADNNFIRDKTD